MSVLFRVGGRLLVVLLLCSYGSARWLMRQARFSVSRVDKAANELDAGLNGPAPSAARAMTSLRDKCRLCRSANAGSIQYSIPSVPPNARYGVRCYPLL
jgi:hypothetical protein